MNLYLLAIDAVLEGIRTYVHTLNIQQVNELITLQITIQFVHSSKLKYYIT